MQEFREKIGRFYPQIILWLSAAILLTLPFHRQISSIFLLIMLVAFLLRSNSAHLSLISLKNKMLWAVTSWYLWLFPAALFSLQPSAALFDFQQKLPIFLLPLFVFTAGRFRALRLQIPVFALILGLLLAFLFLTTIATWQYLSTGNISALFYVQLTGPLDIHPSYLALYVSTAILFIVNTLIQSGRHRIIWFSLLFLFVVFLLMLMSRGVLLALIPALLVLLLFQFRKGKVRPVVWLVSFGVLALGLVFFINKLQPNRLSGILSPSAIMETDSRVSVWKASWSLIKEKPLFGYGPGNVEPARLEEYNRIDFAAGFDKNLNAHNQYLEFWLWGGLPSLVLWLLGLFVAFRHSIKIRSAFLAAFLTLFSFSLLTESMLERQSGIVFYALILSLLIMEEPDAEQLVTFPKPEPQSSG